MVANVKVPVTSVDVKAYKESMAHWATGVSVVTAVSPEDGRFVGITVSSLTSLSVDPPEILISLSKNLFTHGAILASGRDCGNDGWCAVDRHGCHLSPRARCALAVGSAGCDVPGCLHSAVDQRGQRPASSKSRERGAVWLTAVRWGGPFERDS